MAAMEEGLAFINVAKPHLSSRDYDYLSDAFEHGKLALGVFRDLGEAAYATHIAVDNFDNVDDPQGDFERAIQALEEKAAWLEEKRPDLLGGQPGSSDCLLVYESLRKIAMAYRAYQKLHGAF